MPNYTHAPTHLPGCSNDMRRRHRIPSVQPNNELPHQRHKMHAVAATECPALSTSWSDSGSYDSNQAYQRQQQSGYFLYADSSRWHQQQPQEYTGYDSQQQQSDGYPGTSSAAHVALPSTISHQSGFQPYNSMNGSQTSSMGYQSWQGSSQPYSSEQRRFSPALEEASSILTAASSSQSLASYQPQQQHQAISSGPHDGTRWAGPRDIETKNQETRSVEQSGSPSYPSVPPIMHYHHHRQQYAPSRQHDGLHYLHNNAWNEATMEHRIQQQHLPEEHNRHEERVFVRFRIGDGHPHPNPHSPVQRTMMRHRRNPKQWESSLLRTSTTEGASSTFVQRMALPSDRTCLTVYQILLRGSLEYFAATQHDVEARVRGRKQKIRLGQIGVRCRYCSHLQVQHRGKGAVYYPKTLINVYQAAQNIAGTHFCADDFRCPFVPIHIAEEIDVQKPRRDASKAGRTYWIEACLTIGIVEEDGSLWMRRGGLA